MTNINVNLLLLALCLVFERDDQSIFRSYIEFILIF